MTVQQAARILEHEGLLSVKRGPGGGVVQAGFDLFARLAGGGEAVVALVAAA